MSELSEQSHRDVRMRGFARRSSVEEALAWIDGQARPLAGETAPVEAAHGRVLAADVAASIDVPSFDRAAMDGYALRAEETNGAGDYNPLEFRVIGQALPGKPFEDEVTAGSAVRIMTGAPLPAGADAVLPAEYADESQGRVSITAAVSAGRHVGRAGEDVAAGATVLSAGRRLRPQDVGLLAAVGLSRVEVVRRPSVRIMVTGEEIVPPGQPRSRYQIFDSNSVMLEGLIARDGGTVESLRRLPDDRRSVAAALKEAGPDVILVSGGSSVGAEDHAPAVLAEEGELPIHGIAMRPSSPAGIGRLGDALVFLLPGNPVSCLCAYDFFAGRAIRLLGGRSGEWPYRVRRVAAGRKIVSAIGRVDYCRVRLTGQGVEPLAVSGASILSSTTRADGFVIVPAESEGIAPGAEVDVYLYDGCGQ